MRKSYKAIEQLLSTRPSVHPQRNGQERCIGLSSDALNYLYKQTNSGQITLETGCGLSTLIFAHAGCKHHVIAPNQSHILATRKSAQEFGINLNNTLFIQGRSEYVLPNLEEPKHIDIMLIDGGHAFPIPYIDWFYSSQKLVIGGLLVIDDTNLKTVNILYDFLNKQPEWQRVCTFRRTAFFRKTKKLEINNEWDYWNKQPFNTSFFAKLNSIIQSLK